MSILVINNSSSVINIDDTITNLQPNHNTIISDSTYYYLLQSSEYFTKFVDKKFIVCVPIQDNKITYNINNTISNNNSTTNTDSVQNTTQRQIIDSVEEPIIEITEKVNDDETNEEITETKLKSNSETTTVKSGRKGRKTKLVESEIENKENKE